jgi:hypothetical protein
VSLLRRHDPETTPITTKEYDYRRIGAALLKGNNTHVSSIAVDLVALFMNPDDRDGLLAIGSSNENSLVKKGTERAASLLRYIRESSVMTTLSVDDMRWIF